MKNERWVYRTGEVLFASCQIRSSFNVRHCGAADRGGTRVIVANASGFTKIAVFSLRGSSCSVFIIIHDVAVIERLLGVVFPLVATLVAKILGHCRCLSRHCSVA